MKIGYKKQKGVALVIGLIMLLVMTLMGVTSMNATRTEFKMANNYKNHSRAFQTAASMFPRALIASSGITVAAWQSSSTTPLQGAYLGGYTSADGLKSGTLAVVFIGCRPASQSSLTGAAGKSLVHEILVSGSELNADGGLVAVSRQVSGYKTTAADCVEPQTSVAN